MLITPKLIEPLIMSSSGKGKLIGVPSSCYHVLYNVGSLIKPAIDRTKGRYSLESVGESIKESKMQLWIHVTDKKINMACLTEIAVYPHKKYLRILFVGACKDSKRRQWEESIKFLESWAAEHNLNGVETFSRKGGIKTYGKFNYKLTDYLLSKEL